MAEIVEMQPSTQVVVENDDTSNELIEFSELGEELSEDDEIMDLINK